MKNVLAVVFAVVALAGGIYFAQVATQPPDFHAVVHSTFDTFFQEYIAKDPEWMTYLGDLSIYGVEARNDQLTDRSVLAGQEVIALSRKTLATLEAINPELLSHDDALAKEIVEWYLADLIREEKFLYHTYLVNHINGVQGALPELLTNAHPMKTRDDARDYIARLWQFGRIFDQVIEGARAQALRGVIPPSYIIDYVVQYCLDFTAGGVESNILMTSFAYKLPGIMGISQAEIDKLSLEASQVIENVVLPAYERYRVFLEEELMPKAALKAGVWELPEGEAYYAHRVRHFTTTNLTPEEIHNYGLAEVERITGEMRTLFSELGIEGSNMSYNVRRMGGESFFGQDTVFAKYAEIYSGMEKALPQMFAELPKARMKFAPVPEDRERVVSNYYNLPAVDGSRAGTFYVNLSMPQVLPHMLPLAYHEGIPGHHLQVTLTQEAEHLHVLQKILMITAYSEGWALYAEKLAGEYGFYPDAQLKLGYLNSELLRAARLVIDTGLHWKKWTRAEAIDYLQEVTGIYRPAEIDRYIVWPGQALAYKVGELKLLELRKRAQDELGEKFDLKEFHTVVLHNGSMPLEILESVVVRYIESKK